MDQDRLTVAKVGALLVEAIRDRATGLKIHDSFVLSGMLRARIRQILADAGDAGRPIVTTREGVDRLQFRWAVTPKPPWWDLHDLREFPVVSYDYTTRQAEARVLRQFKLNERVRLAPGVEGPECRVGRVVEVRPEQGGCLVQHDRPAWLGDDAPFGGSQIFGWAWHELVLDQPNLRLVPS